MTFTSNAKRILLKTARIGLLAAALWYLFDIYNWMVFEKYQLDGSVKGVDATVDKQLGLDKMTDKAYEYEQLWIDAEISHRKTMLIWSVVLFIGLSVSERLRLPEPTGS